MIVSAQTAMAGSYDYRTVALSALMALAASYAALDLAGRVTAASGWVRLAWLIGGASAMGLGIWSMHFIAMLAFSLPVPMSYHLPTVLLSLIAAIFSSAVALHVVSKEKMSFAEAVVAANLPIGLFRNLPESSKLFNRTSLRAQLSPFLAHLSPRASLLE